MDRFVPRDDGRVCMTLFPAKNLAAINRITLALVWRYPPIFKLPPFLTLTQAEVDKGV
jgi:hypothetical protein